MGVVVLAIEIAAIVTSAVVAGQQITIEEIQKQIRNKINQHKQQFDALKDIKVYLQSMLKENDIQLEEDLQNEAMFQNIKIIQAFLQDYKKKLKQLVESYPQGLAGYIVPTQQQTIKILAASKPGNNLQNTRYLTNKSLNEHQIPPYASGLQQFVSSIQGVDWGYLFNLLKIPGALTIQLGLAVFTLKAFFSAGQIVTAGVAFGSILSAIGLAFNLYTIVEDAIAIKELLAKKKQILEKLAELPKTQVHAMDVIKGSITAFLVFVIVAGDLISRLKAKFQFVAIFTTNDKLRQQLKAVVAKLPNPHQLLPQKMIRDIALHARKLSQVYIGGVTQANVKEKIIKTDQIYKRFFQQVPIDQIHTDITKVFNLVKVDIKKANDQFERMRKIPQFITFAIKALKKDLDDKFLSQILIQQYKVVFKKKDLQYEDELILVKCVAGLRQKFKADDPSGLTYFQKTLSDYRSKVSTYSDLLEININQEDITQYDKDWVEKQFPNMHKILVEAFKEENNFKYISSFLNFQSQGHLTDISLKVYKSIYFLGQSTLSSYKIQCGLEEKPQFIVSADSVGKQKKKQPTSLYHEKNK